MSVRNVQNLQIYCQLNTQILRSNRKSYELLDSVLPESHFETKKFRNYSTNSNVVAAERQLLSGIRAQYAFFFFFLEEYTKMQAVGNRFVESLIAKRPVAGKLHSVVQTGLH